MLFDTLYTNGVFYTQDPARPVASAVGVSAGRIVSLDDELGTEFFRDVHDLGGAAVVPGFNDAHCHLSYLGEATMQVDLRPAVCETMDDLLAAVGSACAAAPEGQWVQGAGYDQNYLNDLHPTAEQLDAVSAGHPVWLVHKCRHMGVANTAAFELAGYPERRKVPVPDGGLVPADADGRAEGLLQETARSLVTDAMPAPTIADIADMIAAGNEAALAMGITSITEPGAGAPEHLGHGPFDMAAFQLARDSGRLGVRATVMPYLTTLHLMGNDDDGSGSDDGSGDGAESTGHELYSLDLGIRTGLGDEWLRIGPAKILSDGSLIGRSAFMCCDYASEDNSAGNRGLLQFPEAELRRRIIGAHLAGWQVATHAIGDAALDVVMDLFEEAQRLYPRTDTRHRIEHLSVASDEQIARAARLGLVPVPQGRFVYELGDGAARAMGPERAAMAYRIKALLDAGLEIPASTDAPVVSADPILNIHALVNRKTATGADFTPVERITVVQAIRAYTVGSAYAVHEEDRKGTLAHGMLADLTVLSSDLHGVAPEDIEDVKVTATVVGGQLAYGQL